MRKLIGTLLFTFTISTLSAQEEDKSIPVGNIISDTTTLSGNRYRMPFPPILQSKNNIEIRFITYASFAYTNYTILTFNKTWKATHFYYEPPADTLLSGDINDKLNIDTVFAKLIANNIFSLPDQNSLVTEKYSYYPETNELIGSGMNVADGTCYHIEFKIGDQFRYYHYCNPEIYADYYPQVYELRSFTNIVEIFTELTKGSIQKE
jgi:hypothetical protein